MKTYSELLEKVDAAIEDVLDNGQNITSEGVTYTKADLDTLTRMRESYVRLVRLEKTSLLNRSVIGVPRR